MIRGDVDGETGRHPEASELTHVTVVIDSAPSRRTALSNMIPALGSRWI